MQDKDNIANIDEQFTDSGWEKMQGVLDNEMPVAPVRKRRWGWLWLLILLPSFFVFGIMIYFGIVVWQDEKSYDNIEEIKQAVATDVIENTNDATTFEENNEAKSPRTDDFSRRSESSSLTAKVVSTDSPKNTIQKEVEKNIIKDNLHIKKENNFTDKIAHTDDFPKSSYGTGSHRGASDLTAEVVSTNISEKSSTKSSESSVVEPIKKLSRNSSVNTERITTLFAQISRNNNTILQILPNTDPIPKIRKKAYTYSVLTGVRSDEFRGFGGINVGLLAHYRLTPKIGLETGLTYANLRKNINTNVDYTSAINAEYPDNTQQFSRTVSDALSLNYLRLPLSFTYRLHPKIQLAAGLNVGYRFTINASNSSNESVANNDLGILILNDTYSSSTVVNTEDADLNTPINPDERIVEYSFSVRKWDLAANAGLRYYPVPRLGIDLSYQYGLLNMTKNSTPNLNSGLQLALVYQLHR